MRIVLLAVFIAFTVNVSAAVAFGCNDHPVLSTTKDDGTKVGIFISEEQIRGTPGWVPEASEPPLPVSQAAELVKQWAEERYSRFDGVDIGSISLNRFVCRGGKTHWYYIFHLRLKIDGNRLYGTGNFAAVLFDGTVIGPKEVK